MYLQQQQFYFMKQSDKKNSLKVIYLDNHLFLVNKEAGIPTQDDDINKTNLQYLAIEYLKNELSKETVFLHALFRLDKPVSGIVIFCRTSKSLSRMNVQSRDNKILKKYLAIIENTLEKKEGVLENFLVHGNFKANISNKNNKNAKKAILKYKVLEEKNNKSLIEIELITGRYHQIRAQFSNINHPIVGDKKYGSKTQLNKISLECVEIKFEHPTLKETKTFKIESSLKF